MTNEQENTFKELRAEMEKLSMELCVIEPNDEQKKRLAAAFGFSCGFRRMGLWGCVFAELMPRGWSGPEYHFMSVTTERRVIDRKYTTEIHEPINEKMAAAMIEVLREMISARKAELDELNKMKPFDEIKAEIYDYIREQVTTKYPKATASVQVGKRQCDSSSAPYECMVFNDPTLKQWSYIASIVISQNEKTRELYYSVRRPLCGEYGGKFKYEDFKVKMDKALISCLAQHYAA